MEKGTVEKRLDEDYVNQLVMLKTGVDLFSQMLGATIDYADNDMIEKSKSFFKSATHLFFELHVTPAVDSVTHKI
ncbi:hypothetical protein PAECIP111891_04250 [Paenibacillus allorhizoplanae]|uniref:Uncharacterized protein n=1 Tax=Paenibacillus allorhizoplanae TaxID=2905648 RepID=A0ABN8GQ87_9BACL|nr:hypothetical protein [Paenibacillus allorhizoplanae]CAH1215298.1 hypothetical protein PAECIP111891_04250 [Paenibacillus allorhizoplanae]